MIAEPKTATTMLEWYIATRAEYHLITLLQAFFFNTSHVDAVAPGTPHANVQVWVLGQCEAFAPATAPAGYAGHAVPEAGVGQAHQATASSSVRF